MAHTYARAAVDGSPADTARETNVTGFKSGGLIQTDSNQTESTQTDSDSLPCINSSGYMLPASEAHEYSAALALINATPSQR